MDDVLSRLLNELSELGLLISNTQDLLVQFPGDELIYFQLGQLKHRQNELVTDLKSISLDDRKQVFVYHYESPMEQGVSIHDMAKSFGSLSNLMNSISKKEFNYKGSPELELRAVINQSFGLLFTSKPIEQYDLGEFLGDMNKAECVLSEFLDLITTLNTEDSLENIFHDHKRHKDTITALYKFYESIHSAGKSIRLEWTSPFHQKEPKIVSITTQKAKYISDFIKTKKTIPDETISMFGELGGISIYKKIIEFLPSGRKKPITIKWPEDMLTTITSLRLQKSYHISCIVSSKFDVSTDSLKEDYNLRSIHEK
ncbi:MAG: hypothetical protein PHY48_09475 [Candidatus Cloacimonetes bacterium]|jgi:hypothetical protein|nr:hypothetical protein [Candidatus Cloacimonadota bacterium]